MATATKDMKNNNNSSNIHNNNPDQRSTNLVFNVLTSWWRSRWQPEQTPLAKNTSCLTAYSSRMKKAVLVVVLICVCPFWAVTNKARQPLPQNVHHHYHHLKKQDNNTTTTTDVTASKKTEYTTDDDEEESLSTVDPFPEIPLECQPFVKELEAKPSVLGEQEQRRRRRVLQCKSEYIAFPRNQDPPSYNHTCFAMKARYNCFLARKHCISPAEANQNKDDDNHNENNNSNNCFAAHDLKLVLLQTIQTKMRPATLSTSLENTDQDRRSNTTDRSLPQKQKQQHELQSSSSVAVCDFRQVVQKQLGGPLGVASILQARLRWRGRLRHPNNNHLNDDPQTKTEQGEQHEQEPEEKGRTPSSARSQRPVNVVLLGNSFMRQVWESLACQYSSIITQGFFQNGGADISLASMEARNGGLIGVHELGELVPFSAAANPDILQHHRQVCHGYTGSMKKFYRLDNSTTTSTTTLLLPRLSPQCNDDLAMMQLGHDLRFWYVFRPTSQQDLNATFHYMGLRTTEIDHIVWNSDPLSLAIQNYTLRDTAHLQQFLNTAGISVPLESITKLQFMPNFLKKQQARQGPVHHFFGADNPGMHTVPDMHPCMPGLPDDQVAILLFTLAFGLELELTPE